MNRKKFVCIILLCIPTVSLFSLGTAEFWNLGFSADSRYVCFGQYWVEAQSLHANAEISVVDVVSNSFVDGGRTNLRSSTPVSAGNNGRNVMLDLIRRNNTRLNRYSIEHANQGRIIYLRITNTPQSNTINFQDFQSNSRYSIQLISSKNSTGAAFHLQGTITGTNGVQRPFSVGLPNYYRPNVQDYTIAQIIVAPNNRNYVFIIEQLINQESGRSPAVRYMIETLSIDQ